jgi:hypothetical protein
VEQGVQALHYFNPDLPSGEHVKNFAGINAAKIENESEIQQGYAASCEFNNTGIAVNRLYLSAIRLRLKGRVPPGMKELRHLNKYFRKYWGKLLVGILITIVARIFSLVMPSYVKNIVEVVEQFNQGALDRSMAGQLLLEYICHHLWGGPALGLLHLPDAADHHQCVSLYRIRPEK